MKYRVSLPGLSALLAMMTMLAPSLSAGAAWVQNAASGPVRGGAIHVAFSGNMITFDPAQAFNDDWNLLNGTLYDGLYQFDRAGQPQLDLAAAPPSISPDRKSWTLQLRKGVRFSNGRELTADDVRFTLTRVLDPHLKPSASWGQGTDTIFVGADAFISGKATSVSGIQVLDRYTIRFRLTQPVAVFPDILAESFNMILPRTVVTHESPQDVANHPIGTGPFMLQSWQKGVRVVFARNPYFFRAGKPYLDRVIVDINVAPSLLALKVEKGEIDGAGSDQEIPPVDLQQARGDPRYAQYLHDVTPTLVSWLDLNVHAAPLTALALRQAVAMAINRNRLVKLLAGSAVPGTQLFVPLDPQHDPVLDQHPVYPYDPAKAAALVRASGYTGQPIALIYANDFWYEAGMAPGIQQDLQRIGLKVTLRGVSDTSILPLGQPLTGHQISMNAWTIDYPDAYDIYSGAFTCAANAAGGVGIAHYCDPVADNLVARAESLPLGAARDRLFRAAQKRNLQSGSHVPLIFLKNMAMASPKVGGFYFNPIFGWQYENYWLKP
jgi:ABC-type transport system substrate-binding protein